MDQISQVWRGEVVNGLEGQEQDFILDALCDGEPVELLENGCDVVYGRSVCDDAGG